MTDVIDPNVKTVNNTLNNFQIHFTGYASDVMGRREKKVF